MVAKSFSLYMPLQSSISGESGNVRVAKKNMVVSICCTISGWITVIVGLAIIATLVVAVDAVTSNKEQPDATLMILLTLFYS